MKLNSNVIRVCGRSGSVNTVLRELRDTARMAHCRAIEEFNSMLTARLSRGKLQWGETLNFGVVADLEDFYALGSYLRRNKCALISAVADTAQKGKLNITIELPRPQNAVELKAAISAEIAEKIERAIESATKQR